MALCALAAPPAQAQSVVLISNMGQTAPSLAPLNTADFAQSFTTGSSSGGYTLTSVEISIFDVKTSTTFSVSIYASEPHPNPGLPRRPSTQLATLTKPGTLTTGANAFTHSGFDLSANTTYFVVIDSNAASTPELDLTNQSNEDSGGAVGWSIGNDYWSRSRGSTGSWGNTAASALLIRVNGTVKPVDNMPSFTANPGSQIFTLNTQIETLTLPTATGGDGTLSYTLSPDLPTGLSFDADTRQITGTPTATQAETTYTYTATDSDASDPDSASLTFTIWVPPAVSNLSVSAVDDTTDKLDVSWDAFPGASSYLVWWKTGDQSYEFSRSHNVTSTSSQIDSLTAGTTYDVLVNALDASSSIVGRSRASAKTNEADTSPTFGTKTIDDQAYGQNLQILTLTLPTATGGNGTLTYTLTGPGGAALPTGLSFDANTRQLSGTPTATQAETTYTYKATDSDTSNPDSAELTFTIQVFPALTGLSVAAVAGATDELQVSWNAATGASSYSVWWKTGSGSYQATPQNVTTPTYKITGLMAGTTYDVRVMAFAGGPPLAAAEASGTTNAADATPSFGGATIQNQNYTQNAQIAPLLLPAATGGDGTLSYTLTGPGGAALPAGLTFNANTRQLSGTPTATQAATTYTYTATDSDASNPDSVQLTFTIAVATPTVGDAIPSFGGATIQNQNYTQNAQITPLLLPAATGGDGTLSYTLTGPGGAALPAGLTFNANTRRLSGTPTTAQAATTYTYTATDSDASNPDSVRLTFTIAVAAPMDRLPDFGTRSIPDQAWFQHRPVTLLLPAATGGDGPLRYTLTGPGGGALPAGLTFNANTRRLSGTPTAAQAATTYTYTATDSDVSNPDSVQLTFAITIEANAVPSFGASTIPDQSWPVNTPVEALTLPAATGGDGTLTYSLSPALPAGLALDADARMISGTPTAAQAATAYAWTARDGNGDAVRLEFHIEVTGGRMPVAWLTRMGRTLGGQVVDALGSRFEGSVPTGVSGLNLGAGGLREALAGASFQLSPEGGGVTAWGRVARSEFEGESLDGDVTTGLVGADVEGTRALAGLLLSYSRGEGSYGDGRIESRLHGLYPYARVRLGAGLSAWGLAGAGDGEVTLEPHGQRPEEADLQLRMGALGIAGQVFEGEDGLRVSVKSDLMWVEVESDAVAGLAGAEGESSRLRLLVEGERTIELADGAVLVPSVELGLRLDGGDAEEGAGLELGLGARYTEGRLAVEGALRGQLVHEESEFEEWGASGTLRLSPEASGRGLSLALTSGWGQASSGVQRLWDAGEAATGGAEARGRFEAEIGYGLGVSGAGLMRPYVAISTDGGQRTYRTGARWEWTPNAVLAFEAGRHESGDAPGHAVGVEVNLHW